MQSIVTAVTVTQMVAAYTIYIGQLPDPTYTLQALLSMAHPRISILLFSFMLP